MIVAKRGDAGGVIYVYNNAKKGVQPTEGSTEPLLIFRLNNRRAGHLIGPESAG